jgi:UDP-N-acetylmuramoylalanine--D-glutamate ligase
VKVAILGFDVEGRASYAYFQGQGHAVAICDQNPDLSVPEGAEVHLGENYLNDLDEFDLLVRTPGLHPRQILEKNPTVGDKITTQTNEFFHVCPSKNIIGVTGTKGKGTTATLIAKLLEAAGNKVHLGGNIGIAPFELLKHGIEPDDWVVLELSNFQMIDLKASPHIAVCLMVAPEHLNWHVNMDEYIAAKQQLFRWQTPEDIAVYFGQNDYSRQVVSISEGQKIPYFEAPGAYVDHGEITIDGQSICRTDELKLLGAHNWQNVCAAITAVWQISHDIEAFRSVLASFSGLEHRLEFVREVDGVQYYDDSFGTTPDTAMVAIQAFPEPKIVILGGSDKGADYDDLAKSIATSNVHQAVLIGAQAERIRQALESAGFTATTPGGQSMTEIVQTARSVAKPGDVVLLSTACASFDMFKNYKDRGEQFKQAVSALQ